MRAELEVRAAHDRGDVPTVIVRPPWFYGPWQPERQTTFFSLVAAGRFPVPGDGSQRRSMVYVDNLVQGVALAERHPAARRAGVLGGRPRRVLTAGRGRHRAPGARRGGFPHPRRRGQAPSSSLARRPRRPIAACNVAASTPPSSTCWASWRRPSAATSRGRSRCSGTTRRSAWPRGCAVPCVGVGSHGVDVAPRAGRTGLAGAGHERGGRTGHRWQRVLRRPPGRPPGRVRVPGAGPRPRGRRRPAGRRGPRARRHPGPRHGRPGRRRDGRGVPQRRAGAARQGPGPVRVGQRRWHRRPARARASGPGSPRWCTRRPPRSSACRRPTR